MISSFFTEQLMHWHRHENRRSMPWKGEKDPYRIWLSEVILQQTRVDQGLDYYLRFIDTYPTIQDLANAPDASVFKLWEGLGYYSRCRNLLATARYISFERNGQFPSSFDEIIQLKGVGPYTAAAIASFAFGLPHAVVDGNVMRVLSRFYGITEPIDDVNVKKWFSKKAEELLDLKSPALYNQAIMDLGSLICKPQKPECSICPLQNECIALKKQLIGSIPFKSKKIIKRKRFLHYLIFRFRGKVFCRKRVDKDIWQNLYEFFLIEHDSLLSISQLEKLPAFRKSMQGIPYSILSASAEKRQLLTHQELRGAFFEIQLKKLPIDLKSFEAIDEKKIMELAFPKFIRSYLQEKSVNLNKGLQLFTLDKP